MPLSLLRIARNPPSTPRDDTRTPISNLSGSRHELITLDRLEKAAERAARRGAAAARSYQQRML